MVEDLFMCSSFGQCFQSEQEAQRKPTEASSRHLEVSSKQRLKALPVGFTFLEEHNMKLITVVLKDRISLGYRRHPLESPGHLRWSSDTSLQSESCRPPGKQEPKGASFNLKKEADRAGPRQ